MSSADARRAAAWPSGRDQRLDMFRGLALVAIFIDHAPGTVYENWTSRNFGFSDAAEAFVLMSGIAAGLAYSPQFRVAPFWPGVARIWARARTLYLVHITTTVMALAIFAAAALWFGITAPLSTNNIGPLFTQPLATIIGLPLLTHQLGYFNILPLYLMLLLVTPALLLVGRKHPWPVIFGSILVWALSGQFHLNLPNYPLPGGWFFNPLAWQLIFVIGLFSGVAMREKRALVPYDNGLFIAAAVMVIVVVFWMKLDWLGAFGRDRLLAPISHLGFPDYFVWFDKTSLALPRLLHALALAYVLSSLPVVGRIAEGPIAAPLTLLGRHGLPVFAVGSVLDMVLQAIKAAIGQSPFYDAVMLLGGILILLLLSELLDHSKPGRIQAPLAAAPLVNSAQADLAVGRAA
ncbi:MAG TPA: OpgC domain-containing protein [Devosia sp.]|nr:OpgC domain-containing protein [Devosia sp.]